MKPKPKKSSVKAWYWKTNKGKLIPWFTDTLKVLCVERARNEIFGPEAIGKPVKVIIREE